MSISRATKYIAAAVLAIILSLCQSGWAVIINSADGTGNTDSPANDPDYSDFPYWNNIGPDGVGTGIYLGNGWVLTADHVVSSGIPNIVLNGVSYAPNGNPAIRITPSPGNPADLAIYQLAQNPGLPSIPLIPKGTGVPLGSSVLMMGDGFNRQPNLSTSGSLTGYYWDQTARSMRWGTNTVVGTMAVDDGFGVTQTFYTNFANNGNVNEAQAAAGDSGGAVFYNTGSQWVLAGMMFCIDNEGGNIGMADYGGQTYSASIGSYLRNIVPISGDGLPGDANGDGLVDVADYNIWAANVGKTGATWAQGDFNGDGLVDVADYNIWAANVGATYNASPNPEPATMTLLVIGATALIRRRSK